MKHIQILLLVFLSACSNTSEYIDKDTKFLSLYDELSSHIVSISRDGELLDVKFSMRIDKTKKTREFLPENSINTIKTKDTKIKSDCYYTTQNSTCYFNNITNKINNFAKNFEENGRCEEKESIEILLYVHGGLNTDTSSLSRVFKNYEDILDDCIYPIFINWDSGPFETYSDHLFRIRQGEISNTAPLTFPIYFITDIGNIFINTPKAWTVASANSINATLKSDYSNLSYDISEYNKRKCKPPIEFKENNEVNRNIERNVQWIITSPAKVISTPITYTMGKPAWEMMLRRTNTPFYSPEDFTSINKLEGIQKDHNIEIMGNEEPNMSNGKGILIHFINHLSTHLAYNFDISDKKDNNDNKDDKKKIKVTVMGHSMGAIIVNKLILTEHKLPINNIVHLASADSIEALFSSVVPYLRKNKNTQFYSLKLHPDNENREVTWWGLLPSGSLLVWVDEMYTNPETILNKRSGRWDKMERTLHLIPDSVEDRMYFKVFDIEKNNKSNGYITSPQKHGEFGDTAFWRKETWWNNSIQNTKAESKCNKTTQESLTP